MCASRLGLVIAAQSAPGKGVAELRASDDRWSIYGLSREHRSKTWLNRTTSLYREFEEAFVDVLTAKGELLLPRRTKLYQARTRLRAHKDLAQREYEAAVLRAEARAWEILGLA